LSSETVDAETVRRAKDAKRARLKKQTAIRNKWSEVLALSGLVCAVSDGGVPIWAHDDGTISHSLTVPDDYCIWTEEHATVLRALGGPDCILKVGWGIVAGPSGNWYRVHGRPRRLSWFRIPADLAMRLDECGASTQYRVNAGGFAKLVVLGCGSVLCAVCLPARGLRRAATLAPVLDAAREAGAHLVHLTHTHRPWPKRWPDPAAEWLDLGVEVAAPKCATLPEAFEAERRAWDMMNRGRGTEDNAEFWGGSVLGALVGFEATERPELYGSRWHVHNHALVIVEPRQDVRRGRVKKSKKKRPIAKAIGSWVCKWRKVWRDCVDSVGGVFLDAKGDPVDSLLFANQVATWCDDFGGIMEVLKYPAKLGELSEGAMLQWAAWAPSARLRTVSGVLHGGHRHSKRAAALAAGEALVESPADLVLKAIGELRAEDVPEGSDDSWVWVRLNTGIERLTEKLALSLRGPIADPSRRYDVALLPRDHRVALDTMEGIRSGTNKGPQEIATVLPDIIVQFVRNEVDWTTVKKSSI